MRNCSFEIAGQVGGLWLAVCALAAILLGGYLAAHVLRGTWQRKWPQMGLCGMAILGTGSLIFPQARTPGVGMLWTFAVLCSLSAVFYLDLIGRLSRGQAALLWSMRAAAIALLVLMLFDPVQRCVRAWKPDRPLLFLIDTSGSMSFADVQNGPSRIEEVWQAIQPQLDKINRHFLARYYSFADTFHELNGAADLARLRADGKATDIAMGLTQTLARATREDAAVVLLSDGIDNVSPDVLDAIRDSSHPVYTVSVGSDQTEQAMIANIAVAEVQAPDDFVVGHESPIKATITSSALANRVLEVKLAEVDAAGKPIGPVTMSSLVLQPAAQGQTVQLAYTPHTAGVHRVAVWVDPVPGEQNLLDNRQEFQGLALDPRLKVLYIEGRLRPEYRYLNRALQRDPNIELATLLRIQKERFAASGTVDGAPFTAMPTSSAQWSKCDVILLGDLDSSFLSAAAQAAIEQRVLNGAGLLMIGGQNSFGPGGYAGTPIERALPVYMGTRSTGQEKQEFVPRITPDGLAHPALEGLSQWFSSTVTGSQKLPPLRGNVIVGAPKSGAQVLLIHPAAQASSGRDEIVLATQRYGKGRSAAFTVDTTYLWDLPLYGMGQDSPYNRLWAQLVRWLAGTDVRNREKGPGVEGLLSKTVYPLGENVRIRALVRDERGDATRYAQVALKLSRAGWPASQSLALAPMESRNGMYELIVPHPQKGDYTAELVASKDGKELGRQQLKFTVIPPADEMLKIAANPKLMQEIARATHGSHYDLGELGALLDELIAADPHPPAAVQQVIAFDNLIRAVPAEFGADVTWDGKYDPPTQGILVVALLAAEWVLRRRWQLA